jgi:hypothetical protein
MCALLAFVCGYATASDKALDAVVSIKSGNSTLSLAGDEGRGYGMIITADEHVYNSHRAGQPLMLIVDCAEF